MNRPGPAPEELAQAQGLQADSLAPAEGEGAARRPPAAPRTPRAPPHKRSRAFVETVGSVLDAPAAHDFLDICRRLEAHAPGRPRIGDSSTLREDVARFGQDPYFAFPAATIRRGVIGEDGAPTLIVDFLGLLGPQGAMPLGLTEEAHQYLRANDDALARFLDLFNNRFVQLFYRAWADARPIVHRDRGPAQDRFSAYLGVGVGLGSAVTRDLDSVPDEAKIAFAGLLGPNAKSASRLKAALSSLLGVKVEIEEFVGIRLMFEPQEQSRLGGKAFATLGRDILLGAGVYSVQDKIRIRIYAPDLAAFETFLPVGPKARPLRDLVAFYLGLELQWDVELALPAREARGVTLGSGSRLGWTSWMAPNWTSESSAWRTDARFDLMERLGPAAASPAAA